MNKRDEEGLIIIIL